MELNSIQIKGTIAAYNNKYEGRHSKGNAQ